MPILPKCFDPYLRYAISTDFRYFELFRPGKAVSCFSSWSSRSPDGERLRDGDELHDASFHVKFGPAESTITRYVTMRSGKVGGRRSRPGRGRHLGSICFGSSCRFR